MCGNRHTLAGAPQRGLSLIELVMAIVIIGVGVAALLIPIITATQRSGDPLVRKQTLAIAEGLLEEIERQPFDNPLSPPGFSGPATQANRALFDDVRDYAGFNTTGIFTVDGIAIPALAGYNVTSVTVTPTALGAIPAADALVITVVVTGPNNEAVTLSAFRTNYY